MKLIKPCAIYSFYYLNWFGLKYKSGAKSTSSVQEPKIKELCFFTGNLSSFLDNRKNTGCGYFFPTCFSGF